LGQLSGEAGRSDFVILPWRKLPSGRRRSFIRRNLQPFTGDFHNIARGQFLAPPSFHDPVQLNFPFLDQDLGLTTGSDDPGLLQELVKCNGGGVIDRHDFCSFVKFPEECRVGTQIAREFEMQESLNTGYHAGYCFTTDRNPTNLSLFLENDHP
jgi:hypothetical protein